jgi:glycosyltransferase involved in cell wall biosynthesis
VATKNLQLSSNCLIEISKGKFVKVLFVCSGNNDKFKIVPFIKDQGQSLRKYGVDVDYYPIIGKGILGYLKAGLSLRKFLKTNSFDLLHAHYTLSGWAALIGAGKMPVVLSLMGDDAYGTFVGVNKVSLISRYSTVLTWFIQPFVQAIICKASNIERFVYTKYKSYIIPNGIDIDKFKPTSNRCNGSNTATIGKKKVLFLGNRLNTRKNFSLAQGAVAQLNDPNVELLNPYPISHNEIPQWLNIADVLVLTSWMEGSPNVIKEGMACNCPIVATDVGDVKWVFGDTEGCYLSSFDEKEFSEKLRLALEFSNRKGRTEGVRRIKELGLDSETVAARIVEIYRLCLGKSGVKERGIKVLANHS